MEVMRLEQEAVSRLYEESSSRVDALLQRVVTLREEAKVEEANNGKAEQRQPGEGVADENGGPPTAPVLLDFHGENNAGVSSGSPLARKEGQTATELPAKD